MSGGKMRLWRLMVLSVWMGIGAPVFSQCTADLAATYLVSDRYLDAEMMGTHLILANSHGLVFKNMSTTNLATLDVVTIPGDVTSLASSGNRLCAVARNVGVFVFQYHQTDSLPEQTAFLAVGGALSIGLHGDFLFVASEEMISVHRLFDDGSVSQLDERQILAPMKNVEANGDLVFGHLENGEIHVIQYDQNGFVGEFEPIAIDGEDEFYDMALNDQILVLDARSGIKWSRFAPDGQMENRGVYLDNEGAQVILGMALAGEHLYVRYATRFDVFSINQGLGLTHEASTQIDLTEIRIPRMFGFEEDLILLNVSSNSRTWSIAHYEVNGDVLSRRAILPSGIERVNGVSQLANQIILGIADTIYYQELEEGGQFGELSTMNTLTLPNPILELTNSSERLVLTTSDPDTGAALLLIFEFDLDGQLFQVYEEQFLGTIRDLREAEGWASFLQYYRDADSDRFIVQLRHLRDPALGPHQIEAELPIGSANPFHDIHVSNSHLYYHDGHQITRHNISDTDSSIVLSAARLPNDISRLAISQDLLWIESEMGLIVYQDSIVRLWEVGLYPNWIGLTATKNGNVLAQNRAHQVPGLNTLLSPDENLLIVPLLDLLASSPPDHLSFMGNQLLVSESSSVSLYDLQCPPLDFTYLMPFDSDYVLEVNTDLSTSAVVQVVILDGANRVIGMQMLSWDNLFRINGRSLSAWFVDYNIQYAPASLMLRCNLPLAPVLSGRTRNSDHPFAYQVPVAEAGIVTLPHVPDMQNGWETELHLRIFDLQDTVLVTARAPDYSTSLMMLSPPETRIANVADFFDPSVGWFDLVPEYLETSLSGFALYSHPYLEFSTALPLVSQPSEFLFAPHLMDLPETWWTGLALTNPNSHSVRLRVLGYDRDGDISVNKSIDIPANDQFVATVENWLHIAFTGIDAQWLTLVAEAPIFGVVLYGNHSGSLLGGMPLTEGSSTDLDFVGIQSTPSRWTSVIVTNSETMEGAVTFTAIGDRGQVLANVDTTIGEKGKLTVTVAGLFDLDPGLGDADIKTIRVSSDRNLIGMVLRGDRNGRSMQAYPALTR